MGLSSSQARLLSITARLSSNEYESQQISNAKMRLATQSQEASEAYISALNNTQYSFVSFSSNGESSNVPLTASLLYEYSDNKNQYILTNSSGKVLLGNVDMNNYEKSSNLEAFLECYGITKSYKTDTLKETHDKIYGTPDSNGNYSGGLIEYAKYWDYALENCGLDEATWSTNKYDAHSAYLDALNEYTIAANLKASGEDVTNVELFRLQTNMEQKREEFIKNVTFETAKETIIIGKALEAIEDPTKNKEITVGKDANGNDIKKTYTDLYKNYNEYKSQMALYKDELDNLGLSANKAFEYSDVNKAQWYTNLWYRINGPSTDKTDLNNYASFVPQAGIREHTGGLLEKNTIPNNDSKIVNSSVWISNALSKGLINIEKADYNGSEMTLQDDKNPLKFNLNGITWKGQIYSSIPDIVESNNDKEIAKAEAEYQRKTAEINAKDERYQRQISLLDSEHNAIQTEYESVKNAMNKNIDRSFKAFQG